MTTWFTADTHFCHRSAINAFARPYRDVDEMNRDLIARWNARVGPGDTVWHLGDFAAGQTTARWLAEIFDALHGRKLLVAGNHDGRATLRLPWVERPVARRVIEIDGVRVILAHAPLNMACGAYPGYVHLHGHLHGTEIVGGQTLDVGIDAVEERAPIAWPHVRALLGV
jgi:calcineurin-like phosphoesterase family protein